MKKGGNCPQGTCCSEDSRRAEAIACTTARDLRTTLIIDYTPKLIAAAQIGDGVAVAGDGAGNLVALTTPQRGEVIY